MTSKLDPAITAQDNLSLWIQKSLQTYISLDASLKGTLKPTNQHPKIHQKTKHHILPHLHRKKTQTTQLQLNQAEHHISFPELLIRLLYEIYI